MQARKVAYNKPIAIIYNPNSGKKINLIPIIEQRLKAEGIPYELLATEKFFDTFEYARGIDLAKYSILVACGGDGSVHEVTNGMMARKDGLKIPIAIIPNGSGNDMAKSLGVSNVDNALNYIVSRTVIRADCFKALVDHEDEGDIPVDQKW
jgi:diacylglycerol kinase (ATP)